MPSNVLSEPVVPFNEVPVPREFPAAQPAALSSESIGLESLVHHREWVEAAVSLEGAQRAFRDRGVEFLAVVKAGRVIGLAARGQLGFVMSSRFGFALYSQHPIESMMVPQPLILSVGLPMRTVLDRALARRGDEFHEDVVLVDSEHRLLGLIQVETLAQLQSRLVAEQLDELRRQQEVLRLRNLDLFQTAHAARQSQGLYLGLFENLTLGVALLDGTGAVQEHNRRLAELLNCDGERLSIVSLAAWIVEKERPAFLALLEAHARGTAAPATHEFTLQVPDQGLRIFRCSIGWIRETGQLCVCLDDVTAQRALERSVLRQEKQAVLDSLVGGIAHELNNKLTPVQGFAELLCQEAGERHRGYVELITKSVGEAARIIRQLLELSKPAAPQLRVHDLRSVIEEALMILKFSLRDSGCAMRTQLPAAAVWIKGDDGQLKQVVLNLVINALHAMEGRANRVLGLELVPRGGGTAALVVTDSGCGIRPEDVVRIFDPFFTTKGAERGTGLGLTICLTLVRQHGGDIVVESEVEVGTRVTVLLPTSEAPAAVLTESVGVGGLGDPLPAVPAGSRILVVEDEIVVRRLMQEVLAARFLCRVDVAGNGVEALRLIERHRYSVVISDIRMPEMSGTELYLRLRRMGSELTQRFVLVTGHPGEKGAEEEIAQWGVPVIAKPFSLTKLVEVCAPFMCLAGAPSDARLP